MTAALPSAEVELSSLAAETQKLLSGGLTASSNHIPSPDGSCGPDSPLSPVAEQAAADANAAYAKFTRRILPVLFLMIILCYVDRTNLSFAAIQLRADLKLSETTYGFGSGVCFFIPYALLQVPSNLVLYHVGAPYWLAFIMSVWGVVAFGFAFISGPLTFIALRFLLGAAESGAFPGLWYYMSLFYPKHRLAAPYATVEAAITLANMLAAPLAAGLLALDGLGGLRGWQWVFLAEGLPTIGLGVAIAILLPVSPQRTAWLSPEQQRAVVAELHPAGAPRAQGSRKLLLAGLSNRYVWWLGAAKYLNNATTYATLFFGPLIVKQLLAPVDDQEGLPHPPAPGEGNIGPSPDTGITHVLLTAIPFGLAAAATYLNGHAAQRASQIKRHVVVPYLVGGATLCSLGTLQRIHPMLGFVAFTLVVVCTNCTNGPVVTWVSAVTDGLSAPAGMAIYNSVANLGGVVGPLLMGAAMDRWGSYAAATALLGMLLMSAGVVLLPLYDPVAGDPVPSSFKHYS